MSLADPLTSWELVTTSAMVMCVIGPRARVAEAFGDAVGTLSSFYEFKGTQAEQATTLCFDFFRACMHSLRTSGDRQAVLLLADEAVHVSQRVPIPALLMLTFVHRMDALAALGQVSEAHIMLDSLKAEYSAEAVEQLSRTAQLERLTNAHALLTGQLRS